MDANGTAWKNRPGGFCKCRAVKILVLFLSASYNKRKEDDMEKGKRILLTLLFVILAAMGIMAGKLKGQMMPNTPMGCLMV